MLINIEKKFQTYQFEAHPGEKLLYASLRAGIPLPFECATGTCGSCKARINVGEVDEGWSEAPGKARFKATKREILMCQCTAKSACNISVPAKIAPFRNDDITPNYYLGTIIEWHKLTDEVLRFVIELPLEMPFHAGQFCVLEAAEVSGFRAYSMVNYSPKTNTLEFIIKQKPNGGFSKWAFTANRSKEQVKVFGPLGRATFHPDEAHDLFMIAGGSGIAGLMSILEHGKQIGYFNDHKAQLFFGVRTPADLFFTDRLRDLQRQFLDTVSINIVFSKAPPTAARLDEHDHLSYTFGMVHEQALPAVLQGDGNFMHYLAGPAPMVDALIRPLILDCKIPSDKIRYDKFN